jgi:hypothetical protein
MKLFEYLDYPPLPEDMKQEILQLVETSPVPMCEILLDGPHMAATDWSKELGLPLTEMDKNTCKFHVIEPSERIKEWVHQNIPEKVRKIHINALIQGTHLVPHIDEIRTRAINYVIDLGGPNVMTNFYRIKRNYKHLTASPRTYIPRSKLQRIEQICVEQERWIALAVNHIHDVRNIRVKRKRIILTLSVY